MSKAKILIADDSPTVRDMLSSILEKEGFTTVSASNGIEAIKAAYQEYPDLILLDIFMPLMNGYQVCRLLKNDNMVSSIPILMLTSAEGKQEKFWSLETGADEFMVKNFDTPQTIIKTVNKFIADYFKIKQKLPLIPVSAPSGSVEILSKVTALLDKQLYNSTLEKIKLEIIFASLSEGLVVVDGNKAIMSFNRAIEEMMGVASKDTLGKKCCEVFLGTFCKDTCYIDEAFTHNKNIVDVEFELILSGAKKMSALGSISVLSGDEGKIVGAVCVFKDITKIRAAEQMKADFVSMVTHELKAPLSIIKASANNILDGISGEINRDQKTCLDIIKNTSERLLGLANDLLDLSKLESGAYELNLEDVDIREVIQNCLKDFEILISQKKLKVSFDSKKEFPLARADFNKLEQVFINLISNAVKFTPVAGEIRINAEVGDDVIKFSVSDTGKGIPKDAQERIFDKFQQIYDKEARKLGGTGLGLSVTRAIVEAHKGQIWVESPPTGEERGLGKGSKFIFTIPKK